jgi:hypothetical protein
MEVAALLVTTLALAGVAVGAGLRRMSDRHIFHQWSGWSEPRRGTFPWSKATQDRYCVECNKVARRKVRARAR